MLSFRFKALINNDFNTTTLAQQIHNKFYFVVLRSQHIRLLLCRCCVCILLIF